MEQTLIKAHKAANKDGRLRFVFATAYGMKITLKNPRLNQNVICVSGDGTAAMIDRHGVWEKAKPLFKERA